MTVLSETITPFREWLKDEKHIDLDKEAICDEELQCYEDEYNEEMHKYLH